MKSPALLHPGSKHAVLIGTGAYRKLKEIPHSIRNVRGLIEVLTDSQLSAFSPWHVKSVLDPGGPEGIMEPVRAAASQAEDVLLVYYSGHGLLQGDNAEFHLSLTGSQRDEPWTSLHFSYLAQAVRESRAGTRIVILDCCFSGRAHGHLMSDESQLIRGELRVNGLYCLTSAPENKPSLAPPGDPHSAFTGHLLTVMREGIPDAGPVLCMSEISDEVRRRMRLTTLPIPVPCGRDDAGDFAIVRNRAHRPTRHPVLPFDPRSRPPEKRPTETGPVNLPLEGSGEGRPGYSEKPNFRRVKGDGYSIEDVEVRRQEVADMMADRNRWHQLRSPYFRQVSSKKRYGYDREQVDAYIMQYRPEPADFTEALRMVLLDQKATLASENVPASRKLVARLNKAGVISGPELIVGYVKTKWSDGKACAVAFTDRQLCIQGSSNVLAVPYRELERLTAATSVKSYRYDGANDQTGWVEESIIITTTIQLGQRSLEFDDDVRLIEGTLNAFLPAMRKLRARHPEWFN